MKKLRLNRSLNKNMICYLLVIVFFIVFSVLKSGGMLSSKSKGLLLPVCVYVVMALSLNLTVGILGELSLGHAGFMCIGAFSGTVAAKALEGVIASGGLRLAIGIIAGFILGGLFGFIIGIPVLKLNGDYLAIVTLAFGEIIKALFTNVYLALDSNGLHFAFVDNSDMSKILEPGAEYLVEGPMGISDIKRISTFTAGFILVMITLFIIFNFVNSRIGRAIMAGRDNRIAAESVGINVNKYKMIGFIISAAIAGAAGALFGSNYSTIVASKFSYDTSILILVYVVLGGQGNMLGSIIAATALTVLPEALRSFADYRMIIYSILLIAVMLITHNSRIKFAVDDLKNKLFGKKKEVQNE